MQADLQKGGDDMSDVTFCTCPDLSCKHHPSKHKEGCTPCIEKNLRDHEIPACFWFKLGTKGGVDSEYTFAKFAEAVTAIK